VFNDVASLSAMLPKKAAKAADLKNPSKVFDLDEPDLEIFGSLPNWLQNKIKGNLEYKGSILESALNGNESTEGSDDDEEWED